MVSMFKTSYEIYEDMSNAKEEFEKTRNAVTVDGFFFIMVLALAFLMKHPAITAIAALYGVVCLCTILFAYREYTKYKKLWNMYVESIEKKMLTK